MSKVHPASKFVGFPFLDRGRTPSGCDCWGLVRLYYKDKYDIDLPSYVDEYEASTVKGLTAEAINAHIAEWGHIPPGEEQEGDVILLRVGGLPCHIGVVVKRGYMLHTMKGCDSVIEPYISPDWKHRVVGFYRYRRKA